MNESLLNYLLTPPALVSFSGGRTSGYMLRRILDAHGGALPEGVHVTFANTGKERPETLDFVRECGDRWAVPVVWLEYRREGDKNHWTTVTYETASRAGEPFATLIGARQFLPNPRARFCTQELKIRVMKKYMMDAGHEYWTNVVGIRGDEPRRVARLRVSAEKERWENHLPLADAGVTLTDVTAFWEAQPFDLKLRPDEGNCDLCFLKGRGKIDRIISERPDLADWWIEQEKRVENTAYGDAGTFRCDRPKYAHLLNLVKEQGVLSFDEPYEYQDCNCTD